VANMAGRKWRRKYGENGGKNVYGTTVWRLESIETRDARRIRRWMDGWRMRRRLIVLILYLGVEDEDADALASFPHLELGT
jgi:hypothetical protein